jgi:hypothetical protein
LAEAIPGLAFENVIVEVSESEDTRGTPARNSGAEVLQGLMMITINRPPKIPLTIVITTLIIVDDQLFPASPAESVWIGIKSLFRGAGFLAELFGFGMRFHGTSNYTFVVACMKTRVGVKNRGPRSVNSPASQPCRDQLSIRGANRAIRQEIRP